MNKVIYNDYTLETIGGGTDRWGGVQIGGGGYEWGRAQQKVHVKGKILQVKSTVFFLMRVTVQKLDGFGHDYNVNI